MLVASAVVATAATFGFKAATSPTGLSYGFPAGPYAFLGSIALIAAVGDARMLARHGINGSQRIARHLWRMCFALFIASSSVFLARAQIFPAFMRTTGILYIVTVLPIALMIYWLLRVRFAKTWKRQPLPRPPKLPAFRTASPPGGQHLIRRFIVERRTRRRCSRHPITLRSRPQWTYIGFPGVAREVLVYSMKLSPLA